MNAEAAEAHVRARLGDSIMSSTELWKATDEIEDKAEFNALLARLCMDRKLRRTGSGHNMRYHVAPDGPWGSKFDWSKVPAFADETHPKANIKVNGKPVAIAQSEAPLEPSAVIVQEGGDAVARKPEPARAEMPAQRKRLDRSHGSPSPAPGERLLVERWALTSDSTLVVWAGQAQFELELKGAMALAQALRSILLPNQGSTP